VHNFFISQKSLLIILALLRLNIDNIELLGLRGLVFVFAVLADRRGQLHVDLLDQDGVQEHAPRCDRSQAAGQTAQHEQDSAGHHAGLHPNDRYTQIPYTNRLFWFS
jgi:hypothetical protein